MNKNNKKMNAKKTLVSFLLITSVLFSAVLISAAEVTTNYLVEANDVLVSDGDATTTEDLLSVVSGDSIELFVKFTAAIDSSNLKLRAELEGNKEDVTETTSLFDVEAGKTYIKTLILEVPSDFDEDELTNSLTLNMKIWNSDDKTEFSEIVFEVQKQSYDVAVKSLITSDTMQAGETSSVNVMVENVGYNDVEDLYVTVGIPELNVAETAYFGDLVALEDPADDDKEVTASGKFHLNIPYTAKEGKYTLVVKVENDELVNVVKQEVTVVNSIPEVAMKSGNDLVLINPTNQLKVYKLIYQTNEVSVILPAASTKAVPIEVPANGEAFDISVFSGNELLTTVKFSVSAVQSSVQVTNPVFVLTVILAIVFLVLLVALIVLITKKPQKTEEFGESYY